MNTRAYLAALPVVIDGLSDEEVLPVRVGALRTLLEGRGEPAQVEQQPAPAQGPQSWRLLFWTCGPATEIGMEQLTEALGRSRSWVYARTSEKDAKRRRVPRLPHRKLDTSLVFVVGEVREWLRLHEDTIVPGPDAPAPGRPRLAVAAGGGR